MGHKIDSINNNGHASSPNELSNASKAIGPYSRLMIGLEIMSTTIPGIPMSGIKPNTAMTTEMIIVFVNFFFEARE